MVTGGNLIGGSENYSLCEKCEADLLAKYTLSDPKMAEEFGLEPFWDIFVEGSYDEVSARLVRNARDFFKSWLKAGRAVR